ncbi:unnamed protein product [Lymnaea stagnalis]|uniref:TPR_REGION domain-containing protein n=1 Tax=Lymnaea stagnalis TaxID=6523 RepID=A0AAV2I6B1_LYMST
MDAIKSIALERRPKWKFRSLNELHTEANCILRYILTNERSKRWRKVIEAYERLLWMIDLKHFPPEYEPPSSYVILLYEVHFHMGLALQRMGAHKQSASHYTQAINAISVPKGGCQAGCMTNSCMLTPLYSRRAFAYCQAGQLTSALKDIEALAALDNTNPDVYCVRALVRNSRKEEKQALQDLDHALTIQPNHGGCLLVKKAMANCSAPKINPESQSYSNVYSFSHPYSLEFYDRMLYTLLVPHRITVIDLTPDKPCKQLIASGLHGLSSSNSRMAPSFISRVDPFRCGTPSSDTNNLAPKRRRDYGEAIRRYNARPKTSQEFMAQLEKEIKRRKYGPIKVHLAKTSSDGELKSAARVSSSRSSHSTETCQAGSTGGRRSASNRFQFESPSTFSIPIFQPVNLESLPRMYHRPWQGDRLPVGEVIHTRPSPAFY